MTVRACSPSAGRWVDTGGSQTTTDLPVSGIHAQ